MNDHRPHGREQDEGGAGGAATASAPVIDARDLHLAFGDQVVLEDISFEVHEGEALAILGASGVGKSTILKIILRLLVPDGGAILIDGEDIGQLSFEEVLEVRQKMGMVFQAAALFDSLSVYENVAFPLREHLQHLSEEEVRERSRSALGMVDLDLDDFGDRLPAELSGGQKKRVGIARAIVHEPKILLYDEPTTGLDPLTSRMIIDLMQRLQRELDVTSIIVSHDVRMVMAVATHVAMLRDRRIIFYGTPQEMKHTENEYVRDFID